MKATGISDECSHSSHCRNLQLGAVCPVLRSGKIALPSRVRGRNPSGFQYGYMKLACWIAFGKEIPRLKYELVPDCLSIRPPTIPMMAFPPEAHRSAISNLPFEEILPPIGKTPRHWRVTPSVSSPMERLPADLEPGEISSSRSLLPTLQPARRPSTTSGRLSTGSERTPSSTESNKRIGVPGSSSGS